MADPGGFLWLQWKPPFTLLDLPASRAAVRILAKLRARAYAHCNYDCATSRAGDRYFDVLLKPPYLNLGSATGYIVLIEVTVCEE